WVEQRGSASCVGRHPPEQLQHFAEYGKLHVGEAGDIATGARQVGNEALPERIDYRRKNNRYGTSLLLQRSHRGAAVGQDRIGIRLDQLRHISPHPVGVAGGPASVDVKVAAFRPPELLQPLAQGRNACLSVRIVRSQHQYGEAPHALRLLRARREGSRRSAAEKADELASSKSWHGSPHPVQPVSRILSLARKDWLVLGATLNPSES